VVLSDDYALARTRESVAGAWGACSDGGHTGVELERLVIAGFVVIGALFVVVALASSWLLSPKKPSPEKSETYECGVEPIGGPWVHFRSGYYVYALLYVIFDIETVFLYPWAVTFGRPGVGWFVVVEMIIFVSILFAGLLYAWKEGALRWR
jgi:NADH-quinone oxidoreductase subunit A